MEWILGLLVAVGVIAFAMNAMRRDALKKVR